MPHVQAGEKPCLPGFVPTSHAQRWMINECDIRSEEEEEMVWLG